MCALCVRLPITHIVNEDSNVYLIDDLLQLFLLANSANYMHTKKDSFFSWFIIY